MDNYRVEIRPIKPKEYQTLRNSTGWLPIQDDVVRKALKRDLFSICVLYNNEVIGIGRVIGDGAIYFYVQDVIVLPAFQKKGVGRLIMENIEQFFEKNAYQNSFIGLMAADGVKGFYHQYGYLERSHNKPGMFKVVNV